MDGQRCRGSFTRTDAGRCGGAAVASRSSPSALLHMKVRWAEASMEWVQCADGTHRFSDSAAAFLAGIGEAAKTAEEMFSIHTPINMRSQCASYCATMRSGGPALVRVECATKRAPVMSTSLTAACISSKTFEARPERDISGNVHTLTAPSSPAEQNCARRGQAEGGRG